MALRYSADELLHLRNSSLCLKPDHLPPVEDWMGAPLEQIRIQNKTVADRTRSDGSILDQSNRRPGLDRHLSRTTTNPDEIVFGPPRTAFASSRGGGGKSLEGDRTSKDGESLGRYGAGRGRSGDFDGDRLRDGRGGNLQRRGDGEQDGEGWSTVKPRKSFGAEGAEKFHGKMGGNFRDEKKTPRDRDDRAAAKTERPARGFDAFIREKEAEAENRQRNGQTRGNKPDTAAIESSSTADRRDRDRTKSWRDREPEQASDDRRGGGGRTNDSSRWGGGRDNNQRVERDPEWFDEPVQDKREAHTQQDFQKWMEQMKKAKNAASNADKETPEPEEAHHHQPPAKSAPAVESGPDKFFMAFADKKTDIEQDEVSSAPATSKSKAGGKSSRFTSFFAHPQEEMRGGRTEPSTPASNAPAPNNNNNNNNNSNNNNAPAMQLQNLLSGQQPPVENEKQAFQSLLAKLQKQTMSATPPGLSLFAPPPPQQQQQQQQQPPPLLPPNPAESNRSPASFQHHGRESQPRPPHEILAPRPQQQSARPEQLLQDLVSQHQRTSSQNSSQRDPNAAVRNNSNTEFLMNLMRAPQKQQQPPPMDHDIDSRGLGLQQRHGRPQPPPGFPMDDSFHGDHDGRPNQPTQILQRPPPPPGLDQMHPNWMPGGQMPPPPQQRMMAPPGLPGGGPGRNMPMPHMFPPNFPPGAMPPPPPEAMGGMPPRNMPMPPPGFFNGPPPPHGFVPPGFGPPPPGSEHQPFGMPPAGAGRGNYGRP